MLSIYFIMKIVRIQNFLKEKRKNYAGSLGKNLICLRRLPIFLKITIQKGTCHEEKSKD